MTGSEAVNAIGKSLYEDFNIEDDKLKKMYQKVYSNLISNIEKNNNSKSLAIIGSIGCGKSVMMKVYQKMFLGSLRGFKWVNSGILNDLFEENTLSSIKTAYGHGCKMDLYIDDIGVSRIKSSKFGNNVNVISEILMDRYDLFVNEGWKTHLSSNLPISVPNNEDNKIPTLELIYGNRVCDRIKEMCEIIYITNKSLRK
jgi:DNA replication protein DnaC